MLVVRATDGVVGQSLLVDPGELGKVHHRVGVVLLRAREERVDPVNPRQHHAEVVQLFRSRGLPFATQRSCQAE